MKLLFNPSSKSFTKAIEPILFVLRLAGLASLSEVTVTTTVTPFDSYGSASAPKLIDNWRSGENRQKLRREQSSIYPIFVCVVLLACFALSQYTKHGMTTNIVLTTVFISDWVTSSLTVFTCLTFVVSLTFHRQTMVNIFGKFTCIDSHLLNDPTSVYSRTHRLAWLQVFVLLIFYAIMTTIDFIDRRIFLGTTRAMLLHSTQPVSFVLDLALLQFIDILLLLRQRYKVLNSLVKDFGKSLKNLTNFSESHLPRGQIFIPNNRPVDSFPKPLPIMDLFRSLRTLRKIHFNLYEIATQVNSIHGFPLFSSMLCLFLNITFLTYVSIINGYNHDKLAIVHNHEWYTVIAKMAWALHHACAVVLVTSACHKTRNEAARVAILVHACLLTEGLPDALSREMERFARQLNDVRLEFTAYGFFKLDIGLLCAMSGAISTYLVILVQFR